MNWFSSARSSAVAEDDGTPGAASGGARHVAVIMDGNGRWAKARRLPRLAGHRAGVEAVRRVVKAAPDLGIEVLTLYAFSSENWRRPPAEVSDLMGLLRHYVRSELEDLRRNGVRLRLIGNWRQLKPDIVGELENAMQATANNRRMTLVIALNYGGQDEIARSVRTLAERVRRGEIEPADIDIADIEAGLDTRDLPPLDLIIRSSGEIRLSNFLLWQAAYAEMWFTDTLWPDFDGQVMQQALETFAGRERRYGGL